ncbi:glutathione S-transferase-like [Apostichopus japonicus]|uniref:glutathione S-transferase-like n=1 Tax=Stichopus japonicus TaxID=307972 RepID=UPI003AB6D0F5
MVSYKLTYFNRRGRAEPIRYLFAVADVPFEDHRIDEKEEWPSIKASPNSRYVLGQVPVLEVDGKVVQQSKSIFRFLGREFGFDGESSWERLQIDSIIETLNDLENEGRKVSREKNAEKKEKLLQNYLQVVLRRIFGFLESILVGNEGGDGFLVGKKMSIADIMFFTHVHDYLGFIPEANLTEPKLLLLYERIKSNPQIAGWLKNRPVTKF